MEKNGGRGSAWRGSLCQIANHVSPWINGSRWMDRAGCAWRWTEERGGAKGEGLDGEEAIYRETSIGAAREATDGSPIRVRRARANRWIGSHRAWTNEMQGEREEVMEPAMLVLERINVGSLKGARPDVLLFPFLPCNRQQLDLARGIP